MDFTGDELAGVVDLFGGLTRAELGQALVELAFRQGEDAEPADFEPAIDEAVERYHLVVAEVDGEDLLVPGPTAFPELPEEGRDLPHIMDVETRSVDRAAVAADVEQRFRAETATAVADGDTDRIEQLLDASYELEVWGPVELGDARDRLDDALDGESE